MTRYQGMGMPSSSPQLRRLEALTKTARPSRPGRVTLAATLTILLSLVYAAFGVGLVVWRDAVVEWILIQPEMVQAMPQTDPEVVEMLHTVLPWVGFTTFVLGAIGIWMGVGVLHRSRSARTWLTVASVLMAVTNLGALVNPISLPYLIGPVLVIVLVHGGAASSWFRYSAWRY